jgi:hypothetical protein
VVKSSGAWSRTGEITPAQIVANTNDYAPTGFSTASVLYLDTDATRTLSGIAGGAAGREIEIVYIGANTLTILHNNAGSATGNKFSCLASFSLTAGCSASFHHDGTFWRLISWCGVFGGDLSGTFPNQVIGSGKVTTSKLADANVTEAKLLIADNTTADVSTSAHGFAPKAPNDTTKYLCGDATWTALRQIVMPTVTSTATTITFDSTYYGKVFLWSPSGTATATLPANGAAAGSWFEVWLLTNQTITITAATLDTLITVNDTAADSVAFSTTSLKIGSVVKFISTGSVWAAVNVGTNTMTIAT